MKDDVHDTHGPAPATRAGASIALYLAVTCFGTWGVAATLRVLDVGGGSLGTRLLTTSLLYALTMGWPPLLATWLLTRLDPPRDGADLGLGPTRGVFSVVGALATIAFVAATAAIAWATGAFSMPIDPALGREGATLLGVVALACALVGTLAALSLQSFTEELGWRGYFLSLTIARFGRLRGLLVQAATWALWYAPVVFLATYDARVPVPTVLRGLACALTCMLLGALLGWLRLVAGGLGPAVVANVVLTLATGLPLVMRGEDAGPRGAAIGPLGWPLMIALTLVAVSRTRWRRALRDPEPTSPIEEASAKPRGVMHRVAVLFAVSRPENRYGPN